MSAFIHGNLAIEQRSAEKVITKEKITTRKKVMPMQEKLLYLLTVVLCVVVLGAIMWRYAEIYEMNARMQKIEKEIKLLHIENNKLKVEIGQMSDPKRLLDKAAAAGLGNNEKQVSHVATSPSPTGDRFAAVNTAPNLEQTLKR